MKKLIALTLALLMSFGCFSILSFAEAEAPTAEHLTEVPEGYTGVYTKDDLFAVRKNRMGKYILMNDITFDDSDYSKDGNFYNSGKGWEPIGTYSKPFAGTFDGNNYTIDNLYINVEYGSEQGLFGSISSATIKSVNLTNADIYAGTKVGGIAGEAINNSSISDCTLYGNIAGNTGAVYIGGIVGYLSESRLSHCTSLGNIIGSTYIGGIAGNILDSSIRQCINSGNIICYDKCAGGIVGQALPYNYNSTHIYDCYNIGDVSAVKYAGGICGRSGENVTVQYSYSIGNISAESFFGGCFGENPETVTFCYYLDEAVTGKANKSNTPKSADQLKIKDSYEQWDFDTVWTMEGRADYPYPELRGVSLILPEDMLHKHSYTSEITTAPTHMTEGVRTFTCSCGDTYTEPVEKLAEHTYTSEITTAPTHLTEGIRTFTCACGDTYTEPVEKLAEHTYTSEITTAPTHMTEGVKTFTCSCGDTYTEPVEKLAEHTYTATVTAPTCTKNGYTTYTCECGDSYVTDETAATGHSYTTKITPATCTANGEIVICCSECNDTKSEIINATGHTDSDNNGACDICGENLGSDTVDCSCLCHKDGFVGFFYKIVRIFWRLFKINQTCDCGAKHW